MAVASDTRPLPLLTLTTGVVLPQMIVTIAVETDEAAAAVDAALAEDGTLLLLPRHEGHYATVGTTAHIEEAGQLRNGARAMVVRGLGRVRVGAAVPGTGAALRVETTPVEAVPEPALDDLAREYKAVVEELLERRGIGPFADAIRSMDDPGDLADTAGYSPDLSMAQRIELLETLDVEARLRLALDWAREALATEAVRADVRRQVDEEMEKTQREYVLRQQLKAIQEQLGDSGERPDDDYRARLDAVSEELSETTRDKIAGEIDRLERTGDQSPEHGWIRTWLDTVLGLPWGERSEETLELTAARARLDADHTGLDDVKERIVEHLAVRKLRRERERDTHEGRGAILALVGPPGVGKTSLGASVAAALGREYVRVALGGLRDEAEIRGHRRTYVGAQPGRIAKAMADAGTMNPVMVLDEVDKVGADWRGDPSAALLEVLDPAQNQTFRDHYLDVELDLSEVLFLATANVMDTIPGPLLDRLEIITIDGYTDDEKLAIARDHLLPRQIERSGLDPEELTLDDEAIALVVEGWTREAGVRGLERQLGRLTRKVATRIAGGEGGTVDIGPDAVPGLLGRRRFHREAAEATATPGVATGLAVTGTGGDVLFIEASTHEGEGLTLTGQLGDVMKESARIALSWVRAHSDELGIETGRFDDHAHHVHVPAGAVPKDGPSAGVTMTTALVSLLTGRPTRADVGMTGEVTLQGRVLPIGGVKQKLLAAHRAGLRTVILPRRNEADLDDVPAAVLDALEIHLVDRVPEVLEIALEAA